MASTAHTDPELMKERFDTPEVLSDKLDLLAQLVRSSKHMVAFTGAGISTSAGISDFRGPTGVWTRKAQGKAPVHSAPTVSALPTPTHMALVELQRQGKLKYLISQNCDGLHRRSGFPAQALSELHGNGNIEVCEGCGLNYFRDLGCHRITRRRDHFTGRFCSRPDCASALLEYSIDFGQCLPSAPLALAERNSKRADLHIAMGTSLTVMPACSMPLKTAKAGGDLVIVNLQKTEYDDRAKVRIYAKTDLVMEMLMERLRLPIPPFRLERRLIVAVGSMEGAAGRPQAKRTKAQLSVGTVDPHDPSLQLSLIKEASGPKRPVPRSCVPLTLSWNGHYREPPLKLKLNLQETMLRDVRVSYDPFKRVWEVIQDTPLQALPTPSDQVRVQAEAGMDYVHSHTRYCLAGITERYPDKSRQVCEGWLSKAMATSRDQLRATSVPPPTLQLPVVFVACKEEATLPKIPIMNREGEFRKQATEQQSRTMADHVETCRHAGCTGLWRGPWGPFIGGEQGRTHFDLTECAVGSALNARIGWAADNPRR